MGQTPQGDIPGFRSQVQVHTPAVGAGTSAEHALFVAGRDVDLIGARFLPEATVAGAAAHKTVTIRNRGLAGAGVVNIVPTFAHDTAGADDLVDNVPFAYAVAATAAELEVDTGEAVTCILGEAAGGFNWPQGTWVLTLRERGGS